MQEEQDSNLSLEYLAGLLDAIGKVRFDISESDNRAIGYDAQPQLILHVRQREYLDAIVGSFFDEYNIHYTFRRENTERRYMLVERKIAFQTLSRLFGGKLTQLARELEFIVESYQPARQRGELASKIGHCRLVKAIYDLQPGRAENDHTKYTPTYFTSEYGIELASISRLDIPTANYPEEVDAEYLAGFVDGRGRFTISVSENNSYNIGYVSGPRIHISKPRPNPQDIFVTNTSDIEQFLGLVSPHLLEQAEQAVYFGKNVLPLYQQNKHHTKQGLYEIVKTAEPLFLEGREGKRRYDAAYFEEIWVNEIIERDLQTILQEQESEQRANQYQDTYLPAHRVEVEQREASPDFRSKMLTIYNNQCSITDVDDPRLLEIAHIVPWSRDREMGRDPSNALVLNCIHHEAYDRGLFVIDKNYRIHVCPDLVSDSQFLGEQIFERDGDQLVFPSGAKPSRKRLQERNMEITWWSENKG